MKTKVTKKSKPSIFAPAGNRTSFMAALAAGADAIYCGLKNFSARMEAKNFTIDELEQLAILARKQGVQVHVAMNIMLKPDELQWAGETVDDVKRRIKPNAIIIQDLGFIPLIRQVGFEGQIHLSTLANVSFPKALVFINKLLNIDSVVLPRELNIDEIKLMADACPEDLKLEAFVHGALCYSVSGRCYWSSYMGGKSSLRGRCVQPCRRRYLQRSISERIFSCCDLSLDVLAKVLNGVKEVNSWKIEGRKKGPHYVFYTVSAYKMLRDYGKDKKIKKTAVNLLNDCLGRYGTHYNFLPQRPINPIKVGTHTGSGVIVGRIKGGKRPFFVSRRELLPGDVLRIGYEDDFYHNINRVDRCVPQKDKLYVKLKGAQILPRGTPVFLKDRMGKTLKELINGIETNTDFDKLRQLPISRFSLPPVKSNTIKHKILNMQVSRELDESVTRHTCAVWLSKIFLKSIKKSNNKDIWAWLPPVVWPSTELHMCKLIYKALDKGICNFVLNIPWQMIFFKKYKFLNLWAGPFCNISNVMSLEVLKSVGFKGAIVSPELGFNDYVRLASESPIPVGIVISGNWPLCISRFISDEVELNCIFKSPKGEGGWVAKYESDFWIFPDWKLDISEKTPVLITAGYSMFVNLLERVPRELRLKKRPGLWNFKIDLK